MRSQAFFNQREAGGVAASGTPILPASPSREFLQLQNTGSSPAKIRFGADPDAVNGFSIPAGGNRDLRCPGAYRRLVHVGRRLVLPRVRLTRMGGFSSPATPGVTQGELAAAMATAPAILPQDYTVATLPDPRDFLGKYARVTDLFGVKEDLVLASRAGSLFFWQPVRPVHAAKAALTQDTTLQALRDPSVLIFDATIPLGTTRKVTLSPTLAFPGASFRIRHRGSILGGLNILGVNLGTPVSILTNGSQEFVFDVTDGWVQVT